MVEHLKHLVANTCLSFCMSKKAVTKNLLQGKLCSNCAFDKIPFEERPYSCLAKVSTAFFQQTCEGWASIAEGYLIAVVTQSQFNQFLVEKEMTFKIDGETTIKGIRLYNEKREIVYDQLFNDGPYSFPDGGGQLTLKTR